MVKKAKVKELKIDIGCGSKKKEGFIGIDRIPFKEVDKVFDVGKKRWPFADNSVTEGYCSHFIEHLDQLERIHFCNELYRVMVPEAKCTIIIPHWCAARAFGDPTHKWPPVSEWFFFYLRKKWRMEQAPHTDIEYWPQGYKCDFDGTWSYGMHAGLLSRNDEFKQFALNFYKEAAQDIHATLIKK